MRDRPTAGRLVGAKSPAPCPSSSLRLQPPKQPCTHPFTAHPEVSGAPFGPASRSIPVIPRLKLVRVRSLAAPAVAGAGAGRLPPPAGCHPCSFGEMDRRLQAREEQFTGLGICHNITVFSWVGAGRPSPVTLRAPCTCRAWAGTGWGWLGAGTLNAVGPGLAPGEQCTCVRIQTEV